MRFYKRNNGEIYEKRETEIPASENCEEITEEEYNTAIAEINERIQTEIENDITVERDNLEEQAQAYKILLGDEK